MSTFEDFDRMVADFMNEWGFVCTYIHTIGSVPNDLTGTVNVVTESIEVQAIKSDLVRPNEGVRGKSGTLIEGAELMLYVRPTDKLTLFADAMRVNPTGDRVNINGVLWKVVTVKEYNPSSNDCILYEMYIKR